MSPASLRNLWRRFWSIFAPVWNALERLILHDGFEIAGFMAFSTLLAVFPFLIFLIALPPSSTPRARRAKP